MPILLLIVCALVLFALMLLLWPLALWNRYRVGTSRRQPVRWLTRLNAWLIPASAVLFLGGMAITQLFVAQALPYAALGVLAGLGTGALGWALTRVEHRPGQVWYTPNRWLVLALTVVVVARVVGAIWQALARWRGDEAALAAWGALGEPAGLFAVAGLVIGYHAAYAVLLQWRLGPWLR